MTCAVGWKRFLAAAVIALSVLAAPVAAEDALTREERSELSRTKIAPEVQNPLTDTAAVDGITRVLFQSTEEKDQVAAQVGGDVGGRWLWSVKLRGPTSKSGGETTLATLDGLADSTTAEAGFGQLFWNVDEGDLIDPLAEIVEKHLLEPIASDQCSLETLSKRGTTWCEKADSAIAAALAQVCRAYNGGSPTPPPIVIEAGLCTYDRLAAKGAAWEAQAASAVREGLATTCSTYNAEGSLGTAYTYLTLKEKRPDLARELLDQVDPGRVLSYSIRFAVGRQAYESADPATLDKVTERHNNYSGSASFSWLTRSDWYLEWAGRHERVFKAGESTEVCKPIAGTGGFDCRTLALTAPSETDKTVLQFGTRRFFGAHLGIGPLVSFETTEDVLGVQVPVYFLRDKKKGLNGGVTAGWRSDTEEVSLTAFIGDAFGFLGQ